MQRHSVHTNAWTLYISRTFQFSSWCVYHIGRKKIDPSYFVKRENYCKDTLKTNTGMGMNLDSEHFCIYVIITVCRFSCKTSEFY